MCPVDGFVSERNFTSVDVSLLPRVLAPGTNSGRFSFDCQHIKAASSLTEQRIFQVQLGCIAILMSFEPTSVFGSSMQILHLGLVLQLTWVFSIPLAVNLNSGSGTEVQRICNCPKIQAGRSSQSPFRVNKAGLVFHLCKMCSYLNCAWLGTNEDHLDLPALGSQKWNAHFTSISQFFFPGRNSGWLGLLFYERSYTLRYAYNRKMSLTPHFRLWILTNMCLTSFLMIPRKCKTRGTLNQTMSICLWPRRWKKIIRINDYWI